MRSSVDTAERKNFLITDSSKAEKKVPRQISSSSLCGTAAANKNKESSKIDVCGPTKLDDKLDRIYLLSRGDANRRTWGLETKAKGMREWKFNLIKTKIKVVLIVWTLAWREKDSTASTKQYWSSFSYFFEWFEATNLHKHQGHLGKKMPGNWEVGEK